MKVLVEVGWMVDPDAETTLNKLTIDMAEADTIIIGGRWSPNVAAHIIEQAVGSMNSVIISPYSDETPCWAQALHPGFNIHLNIFSLSGEKFAHSHFLSEMFKGIFELNVAQVSVLRRALLRLYSSRRDPSVEDVLSAVEVETTELRGQDSIVLIELLESMSRGRLGAACQSSIELPKGSSAVIMSGLPPHYASIMAIILLRRLCIEGFKGIVEVRDVDFLLNFAGSAWKLIVDVIFKLARGGSTVIISSRSVTSLPISLRAEAHMTIMGAPSTLEDLRYIKGLIGNRAVSLLNNRERHAYKLTTSSGIVEVPLERLEKAKVEETIRPPKETPKPMLYVKLGDRAKMAYDVLSFLRDGASTRDSTISYAMHKLDITSLEASRLINSLIIHGLASEVVGADGKYWLKITPKGLSAIEELEVLEGWLT